MGKIQPRESSSQHVTYAPLHFHTNENKSGIDAFTTILDFLPYHEPTNAKAESERNTEIKHKSKVTYQCHLGAAIVQVALVADLDDAHAVCNVVDC